MTEFCREWFSVGVTRIESNRNRHFGLKIESKSIENQNLEIVTVLINTGKEHNITEMSSTTSTMTNHLLLLPEPIGLLMEHDVYGMSSSRCDFNGAELSML